MIAYATRTTSVDVFSSNDSKRRGKIESWLSAWKATSAAPSTSGRETTASVAFPLPMSSWLHRSEKLLQTIPDSMQLVSGLCCGLSQGHKPRGDCRKVNIFEWPLIGSASERSGTLGANQLRLAAVRLGPAAHSVHLSLELTSGSSDAVLNGINQYIRKASSGEEQILSAQV
ncbi:hypothetical protein CC2G_012001 [Coprinopsis cinerea AmutBmut pab1-1]|nr:hypothetical protein CC2G_012001 [Coprinopsis cinerea AmutBmut pab1-1]